MEIEIANTIGAIGIVVHLGKQLDLSIEESLNNMYMSLLHVHNQTNHHKQVKMLIETSTGQGSEICYEIDKLAHLFRKFSKHRNEEISERFGICLDTCHIFAAGYDLTNKNLIKIFFDKFDDLIGLQNIKLVHLNDSKKEVGSKVDRHENIGNGYIGKNNLLLITNIFKRLGVPIILETPFENQNNDLKLLINK
jgi:deoxyribonuclease-4